VSANRDARGYTRSNSTKSPASGAGNVRELRLMPHVGKVRKSCARKSVFMQSAVEVPMFVCLRSSFCHVSEVGRP
jgi:hypothetical protein